MGGRFVHTGQVIVDLVMRVPTLPPAGGDVMADTTEALPGGGFNVMSAAARAGARVLYAGAHGIGGFGDKVRDALRAEGISIVRDTSDVGDTGVCVALVDDSGERTFVTGAGAEGRMIPAWLGEVAAGAGDIVYVTGYSLLSESNRRALLGWLPGLSGAGVLLDPGPLIGEVPVGALSEILAWVDILSCSATEARTLTGTADATPAALALAARLCPDAVVIVRDGPAGCVLVRDGEAQIVPGFPVRPVDTNGAGDTHCGVFAAALLEAGDPKGADPGTAAVRANAAAALSVLRPGPATAPTRKELDAFLATHR